MAPKPSAARNRARRKSSSSSSRSRSVSSRSSVRRRSSSSAGSSVSPVLRRRRRSSTSVSSRSSSSSFNRRRRASSTPPPARRNRTRRSSTPPRVARRAIVRGNRNAGRFVGRSRSKSRSFSPPRRQRNESPLRPVKTKVVVRNLTENTTREHLREIFSNFGNLLVIDRAEDPFFDKRTNAYITFENHFDASKAVYSLNEAIMDGNQVGVEIMPERADYAQNRNSTAWRRTGGNRYQDGNSNSNWNRNGNWRNNQNHFNRRSPPIRAGRRRRSYS